LGRTGGVIEYYQTQPEVVRMLSGPSPEVAAQQWLAQAFYSHPKIDGMFIARLTSIDRLAACDPFFGCAGLFLAALAGRCGRLAGCLCLASSPPLPDNRMTTDIVGAVRTPEGAIFGYLGVSVLWRESGDAFRQSILRIRRSARCSTRPACPFSPTISFQRWHCGTGVEQSHSRDAREQDGTPRTERNLYSYTTNDPTGWLIVIKQPKSVAYKPVRDLRVKISIPAVWLIVLTAVGAGLTGKFARRQARSRTTN